MIKVYINGRFLCQRQTGVNRFAYEMTKALVLLGINVTVVTPNKEILEEYDVTMFDIVRFGFGSSHLWEQLVLPLYCLFKKGFLVNFSGLGPIAVRNKIITIHDLAFFENPRWYSKAYSFFYKLMTPICAGTSKFILTVSEFSKQEIHRLLKIPYDKIEVLYNAVSDKFLSGGSGQLDDDEEMYILAVSTIDPRKNFVRLIHSFDKWEKKDSVKLYVVGGESAVFSSSIRETNDNVKWLGRVSDDELLVYYKKALCFIYPSLYEGFGIPPLEAMACGTPVVASDIPPLREVCGNAAVYVNPYDETDIVSGINRVCFNNELRLKMRENGFNRIKLFAWQKSAEKLINIIDRLSKT